MCNRGEELMKIVLGKGITEIGTLVGELFKCHSLKCNGFTTE
jgi:hypothetical protein